MAQPNGPYPTSEISFWVRSSYAGVFALSKDAKHWDTMGTSEKDVKAAIQEILEKTREQWFQFYYAESPSRLFAVECEWYHRFNPSNYYDHPKPIHTQEFVKCPIRGCQLR